MKETCQGQVRRQGTNQRREYQELSPGTPVWVQHKHHENWAPATLGNNADEPNSYSIMCENGTEQPRIYRCTHTALKIRSCSTDGEAKSHLKEYMPELVSKQLHHTTFVNTRRKLTEGNSHHKSSSGSVQPPLPSLDLQDSKKILRKDRKIASMQYHLVLMV